MKSKALGWFYGFCGLLTGVVLASVAIYISITYHASPRQYDHIAELPPRTVGLVLGTSKYRVGGGINLYYRARIEHAAKLYHAGKVCYLLVSGDNRRHDYNEPELMRRDLMALGVPEKRIVADYAGLRTLDSVLRAEKIFGQRDYVIISQKFHTARALWLAYQHGQNPIAYNVPDPPLWRYRLKTELREIMARNKAWGDILIQQPAKHYGKPLPIPACPQDSAP